MRFISLWILCLIIPFGGVQAQSQTVGLFFNDSLAYNGYTLFSPLTYNITFLIDNCGYEVHQWESQYAAGEMAYLREDGSLLRAGVVSTPFFSGGGLGGMLEIFDWDGELIWQYPYYSEEYHQHHDLEPLPNGNFLLIAWYKYTPAEAIAQGKDPDMLLDEIWLDHIIEIKPIGSGDAEIVWEWNPMDHLVQDFDASKENYGIVSEHPEKIDINYSDDSGQGAKLDWMHTNSVSFNAELDQIMISVRQYSEVWIIDHSTSTEEAKGSTGGTYGKGGDILYRWGNPEAYGRGDENDQMLRYMHNANWIPAAYPDGGKILVFNNDADVQQSNVVIFDPPQDASGFYSDPGQSAYGPDQYDWIYEDPYLYSRVVSGAQRLPNGNTLICEGQGGNFLEVTHDTKELVWKYRCPVGILGPIVQGEPPFGISVFKTLRYDPDYSAFDGKDMSPGEPIELEPWAYECTIYGDTSASIRQYAGNLGEIDIINPFTEKLQIQWEYRDPLIVRIFNIQSNLLLEQKIHGNKLLVPTENWPAGIYIVYLEDPQNGNYQSLKAIKL